MRQVFRAGALGRPRGMGWRGRQEGGSGWGTHVNPWLIHGNVRQKTLQYCKVISLQIIKINGKKNKNKTITSSVQFSRTVMSDSLRPMDCMQHARPPCPSPTPWNSPKFMSIELVMPSNHLILCCPLLLLPSIFPSIRVFSNESALCIRWPKYWSLSFNISPSNEHSGLISFRMDSLDLLAVQGTLKSLLQHHSSKASILQRSAFFIVQLSHPYMTTGKTTALTRQTFVDKAMSLVFNMLSRLIITFLPRSVF